MNEAKPGDVILARNCWIEAPDGEVSRLTLRFTRPVKDDNTDMFAAGLHMDCKHFTKVERVFGTDEVEALVRLLWIGRISLERRNRDGYSIWWIIRGDLDFFDFWSGSEFQREFALPSATTEAKRAAFEKANEGKQLTPSHRVGIEPDRPAVTIYRVNADGSDGFGHLIGPEQMKGQTWESLAQLVSERILWDSREGIKMMIALQPDRRADPEG